MYKVMDGRLTRLFTTLSQQHVDAIGYRSDTCKIYGHEAIETKDVGKRERSSIIEVNDKNRSTHVVE